MQKASTDLLETLSSRQGAAPQLEKVLSRRSMRGFPRGCQGTAMAGEVPARSWMV